MIARPLFLGLRLVKCSPMKIHGPEGPCATVSSDHRYNILVHYENGAESVPIKETLAVSHKDIYVNETTRSFKIELIEVSRMRRFCAESIFPRTSAFGDEGYHIL